MKSNNKITLGKDYSSYGLPAALAICGIIILFSIFMIYVGTPPEKVYAARVNGDPITKSDYSAAMERRRAQIQQILGQNASAGPFLQKMLNNLEKETLDNLIDRKVFVTYAKDQGIKVDSETIDKKLQEIKENNFGSDEKAFYDALRSNNLTVSRLKDNLREEEIIQKVRDKIVDDKLKITEEEKKEYFEKNKESFNQEEQVKASHILVKDESLAKDLYKQLKEGADFDKLAKEHSTDPGSKSKGGDLGYFGKGRMVPEFEKTAFGLKVNEISEPVKSDFGYHIIKKTDHKPAKTVTYEDVKGQIEEQIKNQKAPKILEDFTKEQREKSKVEIFVKFEEASSTPAPNEPEQTPEAAPEPNEQASPGSENTSEKKSEEEAKNDKTETPSSPVSSVIPSKK